MKGKIATLVAQRQAAQQAASHAAFLARVAAATRRSAGPDPSAPAPTAACRTCPASGGAAATAMAAAESQLGVPYRWGGESPGSGFDCSGLTQWAWAGPG